MQVLAAQQEKQAIQAQLDSADEISRGWKQKVQLLEQELLEARHNSVQGVQTLREELQSAQNSAEQVRRDHANMMRASQQRQAELEKENLELASSLAEKQKEVNRLMGMSGSGSSLLMGQRDGGSIGEAEYFGMQQELLTLSRRLQDECERSEQLQQRSHMLECEVRAQQLTAEEDRRRAQLAASQLTSQISSLEEKLRQQQQETAKRLRQASSGPVEGLGLGLGPWTSSAEEQVGTEGQGEVSAEDVLRLQREVADLRGQTQNMSKLLLKKQGSLMELQAEKAALRSKLADTQNRSDATLMLCLSENFSFSSFLFVNFIHWNRGKFFIC